jgi:hypothetical protein
MMLVALWLVSAALVATWIGTRRLQKGVAADTGRLMNVGAPDAAGTAARDQGFADLPPPVARYLRLALRLLGWARAEDAADEDIDKAA